MSGDIRKEVRRELRKLRLGHDVRACALCGEDGENLLKRASRRLVEFHHLAGEANDPDLGVFLCLTHHTWCTEQMRLGIPLSRSERRSLLERLIAVLRGLSIFFELAAKLLGHWADELAGLVSDLDGAFPAWRELDHGT